MPIARPPRTSFHAERDVLIARFRAAGLQAVLSTNGSNPKADIEITFDKTIKPGGGVTAVELTEAGAKRLDSPHG